MRVETLIRNGRVLDGSGTPAVPEDVAVDGGTIAAVGDLRGVEARKVIDAAGRCVTPGFLDIHRHGDAALFREDWGKAELKQGLTSVINGNCGLSLAPVSGPHEEALLRYLRPITGAPPADWSAPTLGEYFRRAAECPLPLHAGMLAGGGTLRAAVAGFSSADLTDGQYRELHRRMEQALSDGALGVSLGLGYAPESSYTTRQLLRALEPLKDSGTVLTVHMRQEGDGVADALREMIAVARALRTPVEISHLKAIGRKNWNRTVFELLRLLTDAREEGLDIGCDVYPYTAGSTQLLHVLPPEVQKDGPEALTERLRDPAARREMRLRMETGEDFENIVRLAGFANIRVTGLRLPEDREGEGLSLEEIARRLGEDPFDALFDLLAREHGTPSMIDFITAEGDIEAILKAPFCGVISDATYPTEGLLHPRVFGTFARLLEMYVRKRGVLTLEQAVYKVTRRPADRFGLRQKGRIEPGADADLLIFDPDRIHEAGTYEHPDQYAVGMDWVLVSGVPAVCEGELTGAAAGRILRKK